MNVLRSCFSVAVLLLIVAVSASFKRSEEIAVHAAWLKKALQLHFNGDNENEKLKRYELNVTNDGFLRFRKTFVNGKVEYFSLNLTRFKELNYMGSSVHGLLQVGSNDEDVIVQTYNDRQGDIDSMARLIAVPLRQIEPSTLDSMQNSFNEIKRLMKKAKP